MIKNIYIIAAHLDDIEIGLFGYLLKEVQKPNQVINISIYICSSGLGTTSSKINTARKKVFFNNINYLRKFITGSIYCKINTDLIDTKFKYSEKLNTNVEKFMVDTYMKAVPDTEDESILICNTKDIHHDHSTVFDVVKIIARPGTRFNFNTFMTFCIPDNIKLIEYGLDNYSQNTGCLFNVLTKEEIKIKKKVINNYFDIGVLHKKVKAKELKVEKLNLIYKFI